MSIADLLHSLVEGGHLSLAVLAAFPLVIGLIAWILDKRGQERVSQLVANSGIAVAVMSVVVLVCALIWSSSHGISMVDIDLLWMLAPVYLLIASFFVENWIHPGKQDAIRGQIRGVVLIIIVLGVLYWVLSKMQIWMLVHTGLLGLLMFIAALVGILYFLVRKVL
ncbi:MAG: hypothetical protein AAF799_40150 [Myxococcota bacterium]